MSKGRTANQRWLQTPSGISNRALAYLLMAAFSLLMCGMLSGTAEAQDPERQRSGLKSLWGRIGIGRDSGSAASENQSSNRFMQMAQQILGEAEKLAAAGNLEGAIQLAKRADTLARVAAGSSPARWDPRQQHPSEFLKQLRAIQAERQPVQQQQPVEEPTGKVHISQPFVPQESNDDAERQMQGEPAEKSLVPSQGVPVKAKDEFADEPFAPFPDQPESDIELVDDEDLQVFPAEVGPAINVMPAGAAAKPPAAQQQPGIDPHNGNHQEWTTNDGAVSPEESNAFEAPRLPNPSSPYRTPLRDSAERPGSTGLWKSLPSTDPATATAQSLDGANPRIPVEVAEVGLESTDAVTDDSGPMLASPVEPQNTVTLQSEHIVHLAAPGVSQLQPRSSASAAAPVDAEGSSLLTLALLQTVSTFAGLLLGLIVFFVARFVVLQKFGDRIGLAKQNELMHSPADRDLMLSRPANSADAGQLTDPDSGAASGDLPGVAFGEEPFPFRVVGSYAEEKEEEERQEQEREQAMIKHIFEENLVMQDQLERLKASVA